MTETTTKDRVDEENLVDAAARAEQENAAKSIATIRPEQQRWDENQTAILRQIGLEAATQGDLDLFFHVCRTTGLDPFRRQIYMIGRNTKITEWVEDDSAQNGRRRVDSWVTKYTIQTGIDGYRKNGREAAKYYGDTLRFEGPWFTGEDDFHITDDGEVIQHWRKVWPKGKPPFAARFVIFRDGEEFEGIAHYDEFMQTGYQDQPNAMWGKMPRNQIAKCAEALAWRRTYPDDFSGLILEDAAQSTVIDQEGNVEQEPASRRRPGGSGVGGLRAAREQRERERAEKDIVDAEVVEPEATEETPQPQETRAGAADTDVVETQGEPEGTTADAGLGAQDSDLRKAARDKLNGAIFATFGELDLNGKDQRGDRLVIIRAIVGRDVESSKDLTDDELQALRNGLISRKQAGTLDADVTEWLNEESLRQLNDEMKQAETEAASPGDTSGETREGGQ
ncbi:recombinase RecT [Mycolicibacterium komossense]|uniref:Recombinase RecT n=1 Tax=Mycolicibacterium komossense TaxID=1779 RepID=A0ABT3CMG2_9MYCO|nr:recombinase RecT [Mycolicibacterium komossense]MCV7230713.1 recombinase RecT [Mycolicibacterium komossense]